MTNAPARTFAPPDIRPLKYLPLEQRPPTLGILLSTFLKQKNVAAIKYNNTEWYINQWGGVCPGAGRRLKGVVCPERGQMSDVPADDIVDCRSD